jgi:hypothetical protein
VSINGTTIKHVRPEFRTSEIIELAINSTPGAILLLKKGEITKKLIDFAKEKDPWITEYLIN